jgi:ubiquinone/menaquinone biosynthesis C-methylase UbiE
MNPGKAFIILLEIWWFRESDSDAVEKLILGSGISSTSKILEIGCGTGNYVSALQRRVGCQCWGVDPSPEMIRRAMKQNGRVAFSVGSAENLGFVDKFFDLAFSVDVIHHADNCASYFLEAFRVLRPHGLLATVTDSEDTIRRRMPLAFYFPEIIEHELKRYPSLAQLRSFAEEAGFEVMGDDIAETPFDLTDTEKYERKAFSCLRLISEEAFAAGIARMTRDLEWGPISCVLKNYVFWNKKLANQANAADAKSSAAD